MAWRCRRKLAAAAATASSDALNGCQECVVGVELACSAISPLFTCARYHQPVLSTALHYAGITAPHHCSSTLLTCSLIPSSTPPLTLLLPPHTVCHNMHVPKDADMIVLDYSINDDSNVMPIMDNSVRRPFERLLRKLLNYPKCVPLSFEGRRKGRSRTGGG